MHPLTQLVLLRIRSFFREPEALFWTFGFPIVMAIGLGLAFQEDTEPPPVPVAVQTGTVAEGYLPTLTRSSAIAPQPLDSASAELALRRGEVALLLTGTDTLVFRFDPARAESREARLIVDRALQEGAGAPRPVSIRNDPERQPGGRYIDWLIPGLIGLNLMSTGMWGIGFGVVNMRQKKQLKRLIATPMRRRDFLLAQIIGRLFFLIMEVPPLMIFAWLVFGVTVAGSVPAVLSLVILGALTFAGIGLLAASRARTVEGVSGLNNLVMLPMFVLSGIFFSASRFPDFMQPFIQALPLTALNDALRAVYNEGQSVLAVGGEILILSAWAAGAFLLALRFFRWQ